jgi:predicted SAM-dependent methyltransferase
VGKSDDIAVDRLEARRASQVVAQSSSRLFSRVRVRRMIGALVRNRSVHLSRNEIRRKRYLNLGCGGNLFKDFINLDYGWTKGLDVCWDVSQGLPLESNSLLGIFTEHTLEHFTWEDSIKVFLPECLRVLEPGGTIRIVVPDAEMCLEQYQHAKMNGETEIPFRDPYTGSNRIPLTPMLRVNNTFRRIYEPLHVGHKFAYDFHTLEYFLHSVGFVDIRKEAYMRGRDPVLLVDFKRRASESLYVEAAKPIS